jgi:hypothetical protein
VSASTEDLNAKLEESVQAFNTEKSTIEGLTKQYEELAKKTSLTGDEKVQLISIEGELKTAFGKGSEAIDLQNKSLGENTKLYVCGGAAPQAPKGCTYPLTIAKGVTTIYPASNRPLVTFDANKFGVLLPLVYPYRSNKVTVYSGPAYSACNVNLMFIILYVCYLLFVIY